MSCYHSLPTPDKPAQPKPGEPVAVPLPAMGTPAGISAAVKEVKDSFRLTYCYRAAVWCWGSASIIFFALINALLLCAVAFVGWLMTQATAHTMEGLNAGISHATELDSDGQPMRIALGVDSNCPIGTILFENGQVLAVCGWYALLYLASSLSETAEEALGEMTNLPAPLPFAFELDADKWQGDGTSGVDAFLGRCVNKRRACVVSNGIVASRGSLGDCKGCGSARVELWNTGAVLLGALGGDGTVRPLVPRADIDPGGVPLTTFSQHQNEIVAMTVSEFGSAVLGGKVLQLRFNLAEWQSTNASAEYPPPSPLGRGDCCLASHGLFYELSEGVKTAATASEDAQWIRSKPSYTHKQSPPATG